jgi:hypothetical protein
LIGLKEKGIGGVLWLAGCGKENAARRQRWEPHCFWLAVEVERDLKSLIAIQPLVAQDIVGERKRAIGSARERWAHPPERDEPPVEGKDRGWVLSFHRNVDLSMIRGNR